MGLTSTSFLATAVIVTLGATILLIWHWRRLAQAGVRFVIMRVAALLMVNTLVLTTAAIYLNNTYLFFASWQDMNAVLSGTVSSNTIAKGGTTQDVFKKQVQGNHASPTATLLPLPGGFDRNGIGRFLVHGPASNLTGVIDVRKPRGQNPSQSPVLMTFAGYPADPSQWLNSMKVGPAIDTQVRNNVMRSPLVVSPQTQFPQGVDTECVNGRPTDPAVETWLSTDVPNWIASHFSVDTNRNAWATIGLSEGGYCAAMLAMHHPSQFGGPWSWADISDRSSA